MAQEKDTSYVRFDLSSLGTMNADANIASLPKGEFSEIRNLRQSTPGEYEIRTNYKDYNTLDSGSISANFEVICAGEYRFQDEKGNLTIFDITVYQDGTFIKAIGLNRASIAIAGLPASVWSSQFKRRVLRNSTDAGDLRVGSDTLIVPDLAAPNPPVQGFCLQYGSDFIVTIYGYGVYAIYPQDSADPTHTLLANRWTSRTLGKDRAKLPDDVDFAPTQNGDLFLVKYDDQVFTTTTITAAHHLTAKKLDPGQKAESIFPSLQYLRIPINAIYYNADNTAFDSGTGLRFWEFSKNDPPIPTNTSRSIFHLQNRAWGYRFVFVHKYTDSRGNHITYRSVASQDLWVPNKIYCPAQVFASDANPIHGRLAQFSSEGASVPPFVPSGGGPRFTFSDSYTLQFTPTIPYPNAAAVRALGQAIIEYNGQSWIYNTVVDNRDTGMQESTWLGAMWWIGFIRRWGPLPKYIEEIDFVDNFTPYFTEVTANDLINAPCTKFAWSKFHAPSDVTEIEIYRTAFSESKSTVTLDGIEQPLYQPHLFGYVGSIKAPQPAPAHDDPTFIDNIPDDQIDFSSLASDFDGLQALDFSGKVLGEYNRELVLGDIETSYRIDQPWQDYQIFIYGINDVSVDTIESAPLTGAGGTAVTKYFYIQYIDADGNVSGGAQTGMPNGIQYKSGVAGQTKWGHVAIVMPSGYEPSITGVRLLYKDASNGWKLVKTAKPEDGYIIATAAECEAGAVISGPDASPDVDTKEAGVVIWSEPSDIFSWKGLNYLKIHQSAPVTAIIAPLIGELIITTDQNTILTNLNGRFEEESPSIGCIGRFASVKADKIIFFLSQNGLFFEESSGPVAFPAKVQTLVKKYLTERITGLPDMANAKRASLGWLAKQRELHLYIPGSHDLGGSLHPVYLVYKFFENPQSGVIAYTFTMLNDGNVGYSKFNTPKFSYLAGVQSKYLPLIFTEYSDGKLYACFKDLAANQIHTLDVDNTTDGDFQGDTYLELALGMEAQTTAKILRNVKWYGDFICNGDVTTGAPRRDGIAPAEGLPQTGMVIPTATVYPFAAYYDPSLTQERTNEMVNHRIPTTDVAQSTSYSPVIRIHTEPLNEIAHPFDRFHKVRYTGLSVFLKELHNHPS